LEKQYGEWVTTEQVGKKLQLPLDTIRQYALRHKSIPTRKISKHRMIETTWIEDMKGSAVWKLHYPSIVKPRASR
jgi:hypothetical protein